MVFLLKTGQDVFSELIHLGPMIVAGIRKSHKTGAGINWNVFKTSPMVILVIQVWLLSALRRIEMTPQIVANTMLQRMWAFVKVHGSVRTEHHVAL